MKSEMPTPSAAAARAINCFSAGVTINRQSMDRLILLAIFLPMTTIPLIGRAKTKSENTPCPCRTFPTLYDELRRERAFARVEGRRFVVPKAAWVKAVKLIRHLLKVVLQGEWRDHVSRMGYPVIDFASYLSELVIEDSRRSPQVNAAVLMQMYLGAFRTEGLNKRQLDLVARACYPGHLNHFDPFFFTKFERIELGGGRPRGNKDSPHTDRQRNKKTRRTRSSNSLEQVDFARLKAAAQADQ